MARPLPPTSFLTPIRREPPLQIVQANLESLKSIYLGTFDGDSEDEGDEESRGTLLRLDEQEREYAQGWLRRLIDSELAWLSAGDGGQSSSTASILDEAAMLSQRLTELAAGGGQGLEDAEPMERMFSFPFDFDKLTRKAGDQALVGEEDAKTSAIRVTLFDEPLPPSGNDDHHDLGDPSNTASSAAEAVGVQTWAAAIILSDLLVRSPEDIHPSLCNTDGGRGLSVAELGAGTGLVGIVCAQLLAHRMTRATQGGNRVVLTDYHSMVLANLRRNVTANPVQATATAGGEPPVQMSVESLDWSHYYQQDVNALAAPTSQYDLLLAADVVYSRSHAQWLYAAMSALLSRRSLHSRAHVINAKRMEGRFGEWGLIKLTDEAFGPVWAGDENDPKAGEDDDLKLVVLRRVEMAKRKGLGRSDESGHVWWTLGWKRKRECESSVRV